MFALRDVSFEPNGLVVLDSVNLEIQPGEIFVVMGASGAGKSTILRLLNGLNRPHSGQVFVDGVDIGQLSEKQLMPIRKRVGMVFQNAALFDSLTVAENVGFAWRRQRLSEEEFRLRVRETLAVVGLEDIQDRMPAELSGGMRKRVGLARSVAMEPDALLYDEPTSGLDPITSNTILALIEDLRRRLQVTSVVVTHDLKAACMIADRIALLYRGTIAFQGTVAEFQASQAPVVRKFIEGGVLSETG